METTTTDISMRNVTKKFGNTVALEDFSLVINAKELLVLLGPSGCGKTTTLNLLAGLEQPTGGEIYFGDRLVNDIPAEKREISMVFQTIGLYPHLNALENIAFPLKLRNERQEVIDKRISEMVEILGIKDLLNRQLIELSGGERQRVAIAKALIKRPSLFLLDEPFSSLDADRRRQLRADLVHIHGQLNTTMLFVTHDQKEAMSVADRIVVMSNARLQQVGDPLEVYNRPVNLWVAKFVGSHPINVMNGYWRKSTQELSLFTEQGPKVEVSQHLWQRMQEVSVDREFILGVRPEFLKLRSPNRGNLDLTGEVFARQVLGNQTLYYIHVGEHEIRAVVSFEQAFQIGEPVAVEFDWDYAFIFDRDSEECLIL